MTSRDVAPIHCRVLWNKTKTYFEVASANRDGVDLNGTMVRNSGLKGGDVLRIGSVDLIVRERDAATRDPTSPPPTLHEQRVFDAPVCPLHGRPASRIRHPPARPDHRRDGRQP